MFFVNCGAPLSKLLRTLGVAQEFAREGLSRSISCTLNAHDITHEFGMKGDYLKTYLNAKTLKAYAECLLRKREAGDTLSEESKEFSWSNRNSHLVE